METIREDSAGASSIEKEFQKLASPQTPITKKNSSRNTRRFSDEQIRLLESIFMSESTKLQPMKKLKLASELGLQPRQVAIWFQNKRARWKSKQIEQDYAKLKANYDCLASRFESLKKEKDSLLQELQKLNEKMEESDDLRRVRSYQAEHESSKISFMEEGLENDKELMHLQEKNNINSFEEQYGYEEHEFLNVECISSDSLTSSENWFGGDFISGVLLDPSTSSGSQWLNFWPV